jgi:ABC-type lipoprotein release transport system permease subunit
MDPMTIAIAAGVLMTVATMACWIPARMATLVDPRTAMNTD